MLISFEINRVTTATHFTFSNNYYHELESLVAEYFKVKFVRSPSSKVIKVVWVVIRMSTMY